MNSKWTFVTRHVWMRRTLVWTAQICMFALSGVLAFLLRFDFSVQQPYLHCMAWGLGAWIPIKILAFRLAKLDRGLWRFASVADLLRIAAGNLAGSTLSFAVIVLFGPHGFPRSVYLLDLMICFLATSSLRIAARIHPDVSANGQRARKASRTLIYGAGSAGVALLREIRYNSRLAYNVRGFLDDKPYKQGMRLCGVPVLGGGEDVARLVRKYHIELILIAIPSATGEEMTHILRRCHAAGIRCKTIPGLADVILGHSLAGQMREVAVEDLLGRKPVRLETGQIRQTIEGKVVLVTGAAGSIGSELCRQVAAFRPAAIVGYEIAESPLFAIDREMRLAFPEIPFYPEIGSIQNRARFEEVLSRYKPLVVYHAAAYKHVPLMEAHVFEAIENNVFGTYNVAAAAAEFGVEDFLLISSDKAVRPTNVMGATKRLAELILLALQNGRTRYVAVRFGNVLGSNGSVVPIFKQQIAAGGPVTVTHPEMRRYFMTIPEACQLVLQALALARGGQICVLDMGEPVKIVDLARNLILLSGLRPDQDVRIEFTGTRPGEKLYEELNTLFEDTVPTEHEKIRIFVGNGIPEDDLDFWLERLHCICNNRDLAQLMIALKELVLDYNPSTDLLKRAVKSVAPQDVGILPDRALRLQARVQ